MPDITPSFQKLTPSQYTNAPVSQWYYNSFVPLVPDTVAPYLAAHGFLVTGGTEHYIDGEFAGYLLNMARNTFSHKDATQVLLNTMVFAFNEGRDLNNRRYEDLVSNHQSLLNNHQTDISAFLDDSLTDATSGYVTLLLSTLDQLDSDHTTFESDLYSYDTGDRDSELSRLKTLWQDAATTLEGEYVTMTAGLDIPGLIAEIGAAVDKLDDALTRFSDNHAALAATLLSDFNSHSSTATAFLTDLGATDLARINEKYDNLQTTQDNLLVNRGFYASAVTTQVTAQVERERNEEIALHNDRINREKWENQHRLYEQKYRMRLGALEVDFRFIQGCSEVLSARLAHGQWASRIRHEVAALSINTKLALLGLREKYYQFLLQSIDWQTDRRMKIYDALFQSRVESMRLRQSTGAFHADLIRYKLDSRSNLALALYGLVERREDDYPNIGDLAATVASLGDDQ